MSIKPEILEKIILEKFPDAVLEILDIVGDNDHYELKISSAKFKGIPLIAQHQLVYDALNHHISSGKLHAISIKTNAKE